MSARTPEECDKIMKSLVNILRCEANCGVLEAGAVANGYEIELPEYDWSKSVKRDQEIIGVKGGAT